MGSGWRIISTDKLAIDIFETNPARGPHTLKHVAHILIQTAG